MDWIWPIYREHVERHLVGEGASEAELRDAFLTALAESTATLYVMEPVSGTVRFKGLGRWRLAEVPELMADPNAFIADRFGGGKFKVNFHHGQTFVGTHNFRTWGDETWRTADEVSLE